MNKKFNEAQMQAIMHFEGPALILAGPGSGKTTVITERVRYLIENYGVNPRNILVITFTKAAAVEMQERFESLLNDKKIPVTFGTFHSVFFYILRNAYGYTLENILKEDDKKAFIKDIIVKMDLDYEDEKEYIENIINEISFVKGEMINIHNYYSSNGADDTFKNIYNEYEKILRRKNLIDFDDMLIFTYNLLKERQDIRQIWQEKYQYILIDEYQDINRVQYEVVKFLAEPRNNLFVVGDDDQSIYRFRGANPEIMLGFERDYKDTKKVLLNVNYRSSRDIVEVGKKIIKNNKRRFEKDIISNRGYESEVKIYNKRGQYEENEDIIDKIRKFNSNGVLLSDIAVIFRTSTQPRFLIERLMKYNIPFRMKDGIFNIYEHWISKTIISYIKIAQGNFSRKNFLEIINSPTRYLSRSYFQEEVVNFDLIYQRCIDDKKYWLKEKIDKLEYDIKLLSKMGTYAGITYIRKGIGFDKYLLEYATKRRIDVDELYQILDEIQESSKEFKTYSEWFEHIDEYTKGLKEQFKNKNNKDKDAVTLTTMHSSKGLEYEIVFIIDANEGITPHKKALTPADIEEERRMFYVAVTRAKKYLYIYYIDEVFNKELECSRFVGEILFDKSDLKIGTKVEHKTLGQGEIKLLNDTKMVVFFYDTKDIRTFNIEYCFNNKVIKIS